MSSSNAGRERGPGKVGGKASEIHESRPTPKSGTADAMGLQFVNVTDTVSIDESSRGLIRRHASRYAYRQDQSPGKASVPSTSKPHKPGAASRVHRFRLGPQGLKDTPNQPAQFNRNLIILSRPNVRSKPRTAPRKQATASPTARKADSSNVRDGKGPSQEEEANKGNFDFSAPADANSLAPFQRIAPQEDEVEFIRWAQEQEQPWLGSLFRPYETSPSYEPGPGALDPFNVMALPITRREQALLWHYFTERRQAMSPLMPYCQSWMRLAIQDRATFHAVLSHYSAVHRDYYVTEGKEESINHVNSAIQLINKRLTDAEESCSNGTIAAVACLITYESVNGALRNIDFHMKGLQEMIRRRGGLERAGFPLDLKRLISWTDLNTANDLWRPLHFRSLQLPALEQPFSALTIQETSRQEGPVVVGQDLALPRNFLAELNIDLILEEMKSFAGELASYGGFVIPTLRPKITVSDKIHLLERHIFELIHNPPASHSELDNASTVAALIYMRSCLRDFVCNFRIVETAKLQTALQQVHEDFRTLYSGYRGREKLVWTLGFGAVSSAGRPEREWFAKTFKGLCEVLELRRWEDVREIFKDVLWKPELDLAGVELWEEMDKLE